MYIRTIKRKNKDGSVVEYVQLAHNVRHPEKGYPKAEVIHSFGRRDRLDLAALRRLVTSIGRFIELDDAHAETAAPPRTPSMRFLRSRSIGGVFLLKALWDRLQIGHCLQKTTNPLFSSPSIGHALFALVAGAALAPYSSAGSIPDGVSADGVAGGRPLENHHFNEAVRGVDDHAAAIRQEVLRSISERLNLSLDLVFIGPIPVGGDAAEPETGIGHSLGTTGCRRSMANGETVGVAVSQTGIPLKCFSMSTEAIDENFIESVEKDVAPWAPSRVVWVMDRSVTGNAQRIPAGIVGRGRDRLLEIEQVCRGLAPALTRWLWQFGCGGQTDSALLLFWLALLLTRTVEIETGMTWSSVCREMQALHIGEFKDGDRRIRQHTELTEPQKEILKKLKIDRCALETLVNT